jgi:hypothetical protein
MGTERPAWLTCGWSCPLYPSTFTHKAAIPSSPREDHSTIIPFCPCAKDMKMALLEYIFTVKKVIDLPFPKREVTNQTLPGRE